ncbi:MAG: FAD-dependent monooxygenase, partial [Candidatus Marinimicrobia bacterium]|nr:FAD-dependent monooxygenase [Candidatus Neomarinimicrobiota bacterium]
MGYRSLQIKLPTDHSGDAIRQAVQRQLKISDFSFQIERKGLDARKKNHIHWLLNLIVSSPHFPGDPYPAADPLKIPCQKRNENVMVVGSGPAGFFAAHVLQLAGFRVTVLDRGSEVETRSRAIDLLESSGT